MFEKRVKIEIHLNGQPLTFDEPTKRKPKQRYLFERIVKKKTDSGEETYITRIGNGLLGLTLLLLKVLTLWICVD